MSDTPEFFLPTVEPEKQETAYAALASQMRLELPPPDRRVYSIEFSHDGEEWTATVGDALSGSRRRTSRSRGKKYERTEILSDPATVIAIFSGNPFVVWTNKGLVRSAWENPFLAGRPNSIRYFSVKP